MMPYYTTPTNSGKKFCHKRARSGFWKNSENNFEASIWCLQIGLLEESLEQKASTNNVPLCDIYLRDYVPTALWFFYLKVMPRKTPGSLNWRCLNELQLWGRLERKCWRVTLAKQVDLYNTLDFIIPNKLQVSFITKAKFVFVCMFSMPQSFILAEEAWMQFQAPIK